MKNKLSDLNDHLFVQLERLSDENVSEDRLKTEIARTKAISSVAANIINNARLTLDASIAVSEYAINVPKTLGVVDDENTRRICA